MERKEALSSLYELYKRFYYYLLLSYYIIKMKLVSLMYSLQICLLPEAFFCLRPNLLQKLVLYLSISVQCLTLLFLY